MTWGKRNSHTIVSEISRGNQHGAVPSCRVFTPVRCADVVTFCLDDLIVLYLKSPVSTDCLYLGILTLWSKWWFYVVRIVFFWNDEAKDKTYICVSVGWKTKSQSWGIYTLHILSFIVFLLLLWIKKVRVKDKTYIWGSVWWKTQKLKRRNLHISHTLGCVIPPVIHT